MSKRRELFEELGLIDETAQATNPLQTLGMDPEFARDLLAIDSTGDAVKFVAGGLHKVLARLYHPDVTDTGNDDRFREIAEANARIEKADRGSLSRWAKSEKTTSSSVSRERLQKATDILLDRTSVLFQTTIEFGHDPRHFSQIVWSQGVLAQRANATFLIRQKHEGGLSVLQGVPSPSIKTELLGKSDDTVYSFVDFLREHQSFGMEPGSKVAAYLDEEGRASILAPDLTFIMDVTDPVSEYKLKRTNFESDKPFETGNDDAWLRANAPLLVITDVPQQQKHGQDNHKILMFPEMTGSQNDGRSGAWDLPYDVAGSTQDRNIFRKVRNLKHVGNKAISASQSSVTSNLFNLIGVPARQLVEHELDYTPLIAPGNALLLYDEQRAIPVVTDVQIIGMIGNDSGRI